jgi:DNA-binding MarR family transcriptional regulator
VSEALDDVARELVEVVRTLKALHVEATRDAGLRLEMPATALLAHVERVGRARVSALADETHLDLSTVSRQVSALERAGLLERSRDPEDSRASLVELSEAGRGVLASVRRARTEAMARRLPGWSEADLARLAGLLSRFTSDLRAGASLAGVAR